MRIRGVDFSGAATPGRDIWLAEGQLGDGRLVVETCRSAADVFGETAREPVLSALGRTLREGTGATGLDFSFGLPVELLPADINEWPAVVAWVADRFAGADAPEMRETLKERARASDADGVELKRRTDDAVGANSPYSFITYYQTLYGVRDLLAPLVADGAVSVPPMEAPGESPVLEIYPAGTLRRLGAVDEGYKESTDEAAARRETILGALSAATDLEMDLSEAVRKRALEDAGGDALDSIVAAVATARAAAREFEPSTEYDPREGCIYV